MSRHPTERHNEEFRALYERSGLTKNQIAELLGVTVFAIMSWTRPPSSKASCACPRHRVDALKVALGLKLKDLDDSQRKRVMEMLNISGVRR